jgi:1-acyl-sn-glycerol-3-phosphate acyltransferase
MTRWYKISHRAVRLFSPLFFRLTIVDASHVPKEGGVIVAANHNSYFDIPLLGGALDRQADYLAKRELFENGWVGSLLRSLGGIPIRRGEMDRTALGEVEARLRAGRLLVLYPEGTRSRDGRLGPARPGIGRAIVQSGVPVVPVFIRGTSRIRPFCSVTITFGKPLDFGPLPGKEEVPPKMLYATLARSVMIEIERLGKQVS